MKMNKPTIFLAAAVTTLCSTSYMTHAKPHSHAPVLAADDCLANPGIKLNTLEPAKVAAERVGKNTVGLEVEVAIVENQLYNPATGLCDPVRLRAYRTSETDPSVPYVAPIIELSPGETAQVALHNNLPSDASCESHPENPNIPHCFNGTNLHTHGLWISPSGNSDNVLIKINPGVTFDYEYNVPYDHPAGTFWYHPHLHGSTALQVSSGMAGALIIRGDRQPEITEENGVQEVTKPGDLDVLLQDFAERTLLLQQLSYACFREGTEDLIRRGDVNVGGNAATQPELTLKEASAWYCPKPGDTWRTDDNDGGAFTAAEMIGEIHSYEYQFGPGTWLSSGRYTSINGVVLPTISNVPVGEVERWRFIHAGVRDTINLMFCRAETASQGARLSARKFMSELNAKQDVQEYVDANCLGVNKADFTLVAADGLTLETAYETDEYTMQPGYRADFLMQFPSAGRWYMIDNSRTAAGNINSEHPAVNFLGTVEVVGSAQQTVPLKAQLVAAAQKHFTDTAVADYVVSGLNAKDGIHLKAFTEHESMLDLPSSEFIQEELGFHIDISGVDERGANSLKFGVANQFPVPESTKEQHVMLPPYNPQPFDPERIDRDLVLGTKAEWTLGASFLGHPYHIHVNPFQIVSVINPAGVDVSGLETNDLYYDPGPVFLNGNPIPYAFWYATQWQCEIAVRQFQEDGTNQHLACTENLDKQYTGMKGTFRDTVFVKQGYKVVVRTEYRRYIGEFVLHCHILDHEDRGMMQNVRISVGDGSANPQPALAHGKH